MYTFVIRPEAHAVSQFYNKGSVKELAEYLEHDASKNKEDAIFFDQTREDIEKAEVIHSIDNNVKGLTKDEEKFHSVFINPSEAELKHIKNNPEELRKFARQAMENYAENFKLTSGKELKSNDLKWYGIVHKDRYFNNKDVKMSQWVAELKSSGLSKKDVVDFLIKDGKFKGEENAKKRSAQFYDIGIVKNGEKKPGLNTHIHIVVSARDQSQKISLHPNGTSKRFSRVDFSEKNAKSFNQTYGFQGEIKVRKSGKLDKDYLEKQVKLINSYLPYNEKIKYDKVADIGEKLQYNKTFYRQVSKTGQRLKENKVINDPYHYIEHGKDQKKEISVGDFFEKTAKEIYENYDYERSYEESMVLKNKKKRRRDLNR